MQFQNSYIGSNQELRKKGKPLKYDNANKSGCVVVTAESQNPNYDNPQQQTTKKTKKKPLIFKPHKIKKKKKKKKQQAQMLAQMEHDLGSAFKDLMTSLDYFWPKVQVTFTTGTASIGHNIFRGIIPLMAAGMKIKKLLFLMMDPMFSSMMYSLGYGSSHRPRPKTTEEEQSTTSENQPEEETHEEVQEDDQTHYSDPVMTQEQFDNQKEDEEDDDEDEEEDDEEAEQQDDEDEEEDDEDESGDKEEDEDEGEDVSNDVEDVESEEPVDGNIDYPSKEDSGEQIHNVKKSKKKKDKGDFLVGLNYIWEGMVTGFDDLAMSRKQ